MGTFREASSEVPAAPREITPDIERDCSARGHVLRIFGTIYSVIGGCGLAGAGIGAAMHVPPLGVSLLLIGSAFLTMGVVTGFFGWRAKRKAMLAYRDGIECRAEIVEVFHDLKVRVNQRSPWRVRYRMETRDGREVKGAATFWEKRAAEVGQEVIALYDPKHPSNNALWTRLDVVEPPKLRIEAPSAVRVASDPPLEELAEEPVEESAPVRNASLE